MIETQLLILATFLLLCLAVFLTFVSFDIEGCEGECQQGRKPCNCKRPE